MKSQNDIFDVIVIGGGASGMMAAGRAAELGKRVLLLEKNKNLGEKLKITGGGRCNITNAEEDEHILLSHYGQSRNFLYSPFSQFGMKDTFSFFESKGLPLVVQARKRAFPKTEKALDVYKVLEKYIKKGNVEILSNAKVTKIAGKNGRIEKVLASGKEFTARSYILATGGISHPETGSTGDGFKWLRELGHTVEDPTPTIVPLAAADAWVKELSGTSLSFMKITFFTNGVKKLSLKGKVLFTHFGLSGPLILNAAGKVADMLHEGQVTAAIDAYPDTDIGALDKKITKIFDANKNKIFKTAFKEIAPEGTAFALLPMTNIPPEMKVHSITREQRRGIVDLLKALPVTITGLMGYDRAVVADGGLSLKEIDTKTMRSLLYGNLYVTGDLLHISRPSGGYSLQLCWTTGFVSGSNA
jgi:predicted Rossmann fold flavoprotein